MEKLQRKYAAYILISAVILILLLLSVSGYVYDSLRYRDIFYIGYAQYPGATVSYRVFSPEMTGVTPGNYSGLEFIGWFYLDENGEEKEFFPSEFVPPENSETNYLTVYGRWKSVPPGG